MGKLLTDGLLADVFPWLARSFEKIPQERVTEKKNGKEHKVVCFGDDLAWYLTEELMF